MFFLGRLFWGGLDERIIAIRPMFIAGAFPAFLASSATFTERANSPPFLKFSAMSPLRIASSFLTLAVCSSTQPLMWRSILFLRWFLRLYSNFMFLDLPPSFLLNTISLHCFITVFTFPSP